MHCLPCLQVVVDKVYGAFASYAERGERKYWLFLAKSKGKTGQTIKVAGGRTISRNQWYVEVQWYLSTSDDQGRKSYRLVPETAHIPIGAIVQEHGLSWDHEGRGPDGENILSKESHLALMSHNFSNVV